MEYVIIAALVIWAVLALRSMRKNGRGCSGDCYGCQANCKKK